MSAKIGLFSERIVWTTVSRTSKASPGPPPKSPTLLILAKGRGSGLVREDRSILRTHRLDYRFPDKQSVTRSAPKKPDAFDSGQRPWERTCPRKVGLSPKYIVWTTVSRTSEASPGPPPRSPTLLILAKGRGSGLVREDRPILRNTSFGLPFPGQAKRHPVRPPKARRF
ncbi:hypothetical protein SAMN05216597_4769 [Pseudomonas cannabina]|nr:hypothetical protein SAMN05216597_4769 [Pseudomonas cannabina]